MFGREKRPVPLDRIEVTVGPTANMNGDLVCDGIVKIDGVYQGSIKTVSNVIISEKARVDAHIEAHLIVTFFDGGYHAHLERGDRFWDWTHYRDD